MSAPVPLARKLGLRAHDRVLLVAAPGDLDLAPLPQAVRVMRRQTTGSYHVVVVFCPDAAHMRARVGRAIAALRADGALWICWPKLSGGLARDLSDDAVRRFGLSTGLVDVKVAAVDAIWSGLRFVRRSSDR